MHSWLVYYNGTHFNSSDEVSSLPVRHNFLGIIYAVIHGLGVIMCTVVIFSILCSKKTEVHGFNLYMVLNLIPDACISLYRFITRLLISGFGIPALSFPYPCLLRSLALYSYVITNVWINALTVCEVYQMLQYTHQCRRFYPTSRGVIIRRVLITYGVSITIASSLTINTKPLLDIRIDLKTCIPRSYGTRSRAISYVLLGMSGVCPCLYIIYVTIMIHKNNLLPPSGKCRFLALYFLLIAFVSCIITILLYVSIATGKSIVILGVAIQSVLLALISIVKRDIRDATFDMFCCCFRSIEKTSQTSAENES